MNIPHFLDDKIVDEKGYLTPNWKQLLMSLIQQLQLNLSDEGYKLPMQSNTDITTTLDNIKSNAVIIYNKDTNEVMVNKNGTFKNVLTS